MSSEERRLTIFTEDSSSLILPTRFKNVLLDESDVTISLEFTDMIILILV